MLADLGHKATPFLFIGLRYPQIWKKLQLVKIGSEANWWEISNRGTLLLHKKCHLSNLSNSLQIKWQSSVWTLVSDGLSKNWLLTNFTFHWKNVAQKTFSMPLLFLIDDMKIFIWCNVIQQIKMVPPKGPDFFKFTCKLPNVVLLGVTPLTSISRPWENPGHAPLPITGKFRICQWTKNFLHLIWKIYYRKSGRYLWDTS